MPPDTPQNRRDYFEHYGSVLDSVRRPRAYTNLLRTYELLPEWTARQIARATRVLPNDSHAVEELRADYATIIMFWAMLNDGCLLLLRDLHPRIIQKFNRHVSAPALPTDTYVYFWIHPNRQTIGWIEVPVPDPNTVIFDVARNRFVMVRHYSLRFYDASCTATNILDAVTYNNATIEHRAELTEYLRSGTPSYFSRQYSYLSYYARQQQALPTAQLRPFHAAQLLQSHMEAYKSTYTVSILSHLATWLIEEQYRKDIPKVIYPSTIRTPNTNESVAIDQRRNELLLTIKSLQDPHSYIKIVSDPIGVARLTLIGHILDFPTSIKVVDSDSYELEPQDALQRGLISKTKIDEANEWV